VVIVTLIIHKIFSFAHDWWKCVTWLDLSQYPSDVPHFLKLRVLPKDKKYVRISLSLDIICSSKLAVFSRITLSENCSLFRTDKWPLFICPYVYPYNNDSTYKQFSFCDSSDKMSSNPQCDFQKLISVISNWLPWSWKKDRRVGPCWQKFTILKPKNIGTCLVKQDQAGFYMWVTDKNFKQWISPCITNLYYKNTLHSFE